MRKYLLPEGKHAYKANLHSHSTCSDGDFSPEELKELYKAQGYSIVAFTDHDVFLQHNDLTDGSFLALNGYEMEINQKKFQITLASGVKKACHMCLIALEPDKVTPVCWHRENYFIKNGINYRDQVKNDESLPDFVREYTGECISEMMMLGRDNGFFVTYNHPTWSTEDYTDYTNYHGMHAMEMVNYQNLVNGFAEHNERVYDDMLNVGKRIYCIAADDCHHADGMFGGITVILADKLEYRAVTDALIRGDFYATEGPEIKTLYIEDGRLVVESSPAASIRVTTGTRHADMAYNKDGTPVTRAEFDLNGIPNLYYFRVTVTDMDGKCAYSNAYFEDEVM